MRETTIEAQIVNWVQNELGGKSVKLVNVGEQGFPDRTNFLPGGILLILETKTEEGKLRTNQKKWIRILRHLGFTVEVVRTLEHAKEVYRKAVARLPKNGD